MLGEELGVPQRKVEEHGGSPGRIETAGVVGSPAADHTTVLVPHHESAAAVAWSPPVQAGPVAARRPWLAGCARDRQVGEEQLLSGARRHVVTRPPTTSRAHTGGFTRPRVDLLHPRFGTPNDFFCSSWNKSASGRPAGRRGTQQQPELRAGCR
jgi:hypothetical protein